MSDRKNFKANKVSKSSKGEKLTLSVRMDRKIVDSLASDAKDLRTTQAKIVQRVLEYFHSQTAELQHAILSAVNTDEVPRLNKALQWMEWGDHAYKQELWFWAIEAYTNLDGVSEGVEKLQRLVRFKLSLSWMNLASSLRREALLLPVERSSDRPRFYVAAIESLCVAIGYFRFYNSDIALPKHGDHLTAYYNEACSLTLIAQYILERDASEEDLAPLRRAETRATKEAPVLLAHDNSLVETTLSNKLLKRALERLEQIPGRNETTNAREAPVSESQWLFTYAQCDLDLEFLRVREPISFNSWISKKRIGTPWLNSYERCREHLRNQASPNAITVPDVEDLIMPNEGA